MAGPSSTRSYFTSGKESFYRSGWYRLESLNNLAPSNLSVPIHPILHREKFSADFDYPKLENTLRITSHFIEAALPFYHNELCQTPVRHTEGRQTIGTLPETPDSLTPSQDAEIRSLMQTSIADAVKFTKDDDQLGGAYTEESKIVISEKLYSDLIQASDPVSQTWHSFHLAATIVHELAHVLMNLAPWDFDSFDAVFIGPSAVTDEHGFQLEQWLFGGLLLPMSTDLGGFYAHDNTPSKLHGFIVLFDWPSPEIIDAYLQPDADCVPITVRGPSIEPLHCVWNVDFLYIAQMMYSAFWEREASEVRLSLRAERATALRMKAGPKRTVCVGAEDKVTAVPQGFVVDKRGLVKRCEGQSVTAPGSLRTKATRFVHALKKIPLTSRRR